MVAPSKLFEIPLNHLHCSQSIIHPGVGCLRFFINNLITHNLGGLKYFLPLLITPLVLKNKSMNLELFKNTLKYYLQTVCWSTLATVGAFLMMCFLRCVLGKFHKYTITCIPILMGYQVCWFFPKRVMKLFTTATSQGTLEGLLRQTSNKYTHLILHSPIVQTIIFMLNSAIILHYKRKNVCKEFWFIQPYKISNEITVTKGDDVKTSGPNNVKIDAIDKTEGAYLNLTSKKFLLDGIKPYFVFGISLDLLAMLMKGKAPRPTKSLLYKVFEKTKTFRPIMTAFLVSYAGIYRLSACMISKCYSHISHDLQHILSAFLGGLSYMCVKRVNFVSLSVIMSAQLLWQQFYNFIDLKYGKKRNLILLLLRNAPLSHMIFVLNSCYLGHNYIFNKMLINNLAKGFFDALNANKYNIIRDNLLNNELKTLIDEAKSNSIKLLF